MQDLLFNNINNIIAFVVTIILTLLAASLARKFFNRLLAKLSMREEVDKTNYSFMRYIIIAVIYMIGFTLAIYSVPAFRAIGTTILAGAGVVALAISFASQQALSNIVSGLFIVIFKPFKIGDRIALKDNALVGTIEDITLRHTVIRDYENRRIVVPNSVISDEVIVNSDYGETKICARLLFGISYDSNIEKAMEIIVEEALTHKLTIDNRTQKEKEEKEPIVNVKVLELGDSSVNLRAWIWIKDQTDFLIIRSDLYQSVKKRFDAEGIEIPFPHRTLIIKKDQDFPHLT